jgi:phage regulator Rha-like protein
MKKERIEKLLGESQFKEMITTQLISWELSLKRQELSDKTIERKIKNILAFYTYLTTARTNNKNKRIKADEMNSLAFEFVRDGLFNDDNIDNDGSKNYRENIYYNIMTGINYIHESYFKDRETIINPLTDEQREVLEEISHNKFYRFAVEKENAEEKYYDSLQLKILKELGIKLYFDENKNPFAYSHELAEILHKDKNKLLRDIRDLDKKINESHQSNFGQVERTIDFTMVKDTYEVERQVGNNKGKTNEVTYRLYKNLLLMYILGLTGKEIVEFKMKYIKAFDYVEEEIKRHIEEKAQLKKAFYDMYNEIRKRNRDLLVSDFNKKVKSKKKAV